MEQHPNNHTRKGQQINKRTSNWVDTQIIASTNPTVTAKECELVPWIPTQSVSPPPPLMSDEKKRSPDYRSRYTATLPVELRPRAIWGHASHTEPKITTGDNRTTEIPKPAKNITDNYTMMGILHSQLLNSPMHSRTPSEADSWLTDWDLLYDVCNVEAIRGFTSNLVRSFGMPVETKNVVVWKGLALDWFAL